MLKALRRCRIGGHASPWPSRSIPAGLKPFPSFGAHEQRLRHHQKRPYSSAPTTTQHTQSEGLQRPGATSNSDSLRLANHLSNVFTPLQFPPELAARILTHSSYRDWTVPHNARLSFVGRRVLNSYLLLFLQSSASLLPEHDYDLIIERALNTHVLGEFVGPKWDLGRVLRWTPVLSQKMNPKEFPTLGPAVSRSVGLYKVEGSAVEATMGGIFHQFGGAIAHRVFHTRLLPHLLLKKRSTGLHDAFHSHAMSVCESMGGPQGDLIGPSEPLASVSPMTPRTDTAS